MTHYRERFTYLRANCPRCGRGVDGELSILNPRRPHHQTEVYDCLECGYSYFRQQDKRTREDIIKYKCNLGFIPTLTQCPNCNNKMRFCSRKWEEPLQRQSWSYGLEYVCFKCYFWIVEEVRQLTLEELNQKRTYKELPPLTCF